MRTSLAHVAIVRLCVWLSQCAVSSISPSSTHAPPAYPGMRLLWVIIVCIHAFSCWFTGFLLFPSSDLLPYLYGVDSAEILARKKSEVWVTAALLGHDNKCDNHAVQRLGLCSHVQTYVLNHALPVTVYTSVWWRKRPSSFLQSLFKVSAAGSNLWSEFSQGSSVNLTQFQIGLHREAPLGERVGLLGILIIISSWDCNSQLQSPANWASSRSFSGRGKVYLETRLVTVEETKSGAVF